MAAPRSPKSATRSTDLGYDITSIDRAEEQVRRASVMDVELASGEHVRVDAFGRDQRDARIAAKVWHSLMYHEPGVPVFGSRVQQVEHIAYTLMLAQRADVHAARMLRTGVGGADAAVLVTDPPLGTALAELPPERVTDDVLAAVWTQIDRLHQAGISHGNLDGLRILVADDGSVALDDFSAASASGERYWFDRDDAAVLVLSAQIVGDERAVAAAVKALGNDRIAEVIPVVQPAALPDGLTKGVKHQGKALKSLRADLVTATGAEEVPPLKIKRLSLINIGMLIGILFALGDRDLEHGGDQLVLGSKRVPERDLGLGRRGPRDVSDRADRVGDRAARLREQGPAVRTHRAHAARVQLPEPDHPQRHRRYRAADSTTCTSRECRWRRGAARWCSARE